MIAGPVDRRLFIALCWQTHPNSAFVFRDIVSRATYTPPSLASRCESLCASPSIMSHLQLSPHTGRRHARGKNSGSHSENLTAHETSTLTVNPNPVMSVQESINSPGRGAGGVGSRRYPLENSKSLLDIPNTSRFTPELVVRSLENNDARITARKHARGEQPDQPHRDSRHLGAGVPPVGISDHIHPARLGAFGLKICPDPGKTFRCSDAPRIEKSAADDLPFQLTSAGGWATPTVARHKIDANNLAKMSRYSENLRTASSSPVSHARASRY